MKIFEVKAFTKGQEGGNPAAVVTDFSGSKVAMQQLATTLNKPVTVFIFPAKNLNSKILLRFFEKETEMALCGHGIIAAACYLLNQAKTEIISAITASGQQLNLIKKPQGLFQFTAPKSHTIAITFHRENIAQLLGLSGTDIIDNELPFCVSSIGSPKLLVPVGSRKILQNLKPNFQAIKTWSIAHQVNGLYVYTTDTIDPSASFHARSFNPKSGTLEDIATGVAAAALASTASCHTEKDFIIEQGDLLGSPSQIIISVQANQLQVGGFAILNSESLNIA